MSDSQPENSSPDYESQFYRLLQGQSGSWVPPAADDVRKDFFDAGNGCQSGIASDGTPVLMLTFTPEGCKMVLDAVRYWQDHNCSGAAEIGLYLLHVAATTMGPLLEQLPPEIQTSEPFEH